jgi:hypothetical protein
MAPDGHVPKQQKGARKGRPVDLGDDLPDYFSVSR